MARREEEPAERAAAEHEQIVQKGARTQLRVSKWTPPDGEPKLMMTEFRSKDGRAYFPTRSVSVPLEMLGDVVAALEDVRDAVADEAADRHFNAKRQRRSRR